MDDSVALTDRTRELTTQYQNGNHTPEICFELLRLAKLLRDDKRVSLSDYSAFLNLPGTTKNSVFIGFERWIRTNCGLMYLVPSTTTHGLPALPRELYSRIFNLAKPETLLEFVLRVVGINLKTDKDTVLAANPHLTESDYDTMEKMLAPIDRKLVVRATSVIVNRIIGGLTRNRMFDCPLLLDRVDIETVRPSFSRINSKRYLEAVKIHLDDRIRLKHVPLTMPGLSRIRNLLYDFYVEQLPFDSYVDTLFDWLKEKNLEDLSELSQFWNEEQTVQSLNWIRRRITVGSSLEKFLGYLENFHQEYLDTGIIVNYDTFAKVLFYCVKETKQQILRKIVPSRHHLDVDIPPEAASIYTRLYYVELYLNSFRLDCL